MVEMIEMAAGKVTHHAAGQEIRRNLELTPEEADLVDMHSFLNVLNVICAELQLMALTRELPEGPLTAGLNRLEAFAESLAKPDLALQHLEKSHELVGIVRRAVKDFALRHGLLDDLAMIESIENLESVFKVFSVRVEEYLRFLHHRDDWIPFRIAELREKFMLFFSAVEKNSHGRYRLVFNIASQTEKDYLVRFDVQSFRGESILMPPRLEDVMRDLLANARKYTAPGGTIDAGLVEDPDGLLFVCEDTGCGIPADEIEAVIGFGVRGSNVAERRTHGGGFGLTKAYTFVRRHQGRFWIRSTVGEGTRISFWLPLRSAKTVGFSPS